MSEKDLSSSDVIQICPYASKIDVIESKLNSISKECCSKKELEQKVKTTILLEQLIRSLDEFKKSTSLREKKFVENTNKSFEVLKNDIEELKKAQDTFRKYINYALGALFIIYFLKLDKKIAAILTGG